MLFCPFCGALLALERHSDHFRFSCPTCRYVSPVRTAQITSFPVESQKYQQLLQQEQNELLAQKGVDWEKFSEKTKTQIRCADPDCGGQEAFFDQIQIRSADEPPTTFYECTTCKKRWKTD